MPFVMAVVGLLPASLQSTLQQIVHRVNGLQGGIRAILISTAEGVPLGRVYADNMSNGSNNIIEQQQQQLGGAAASSFSINFNEEVLASLESTWAPASKQFPLLHLGKEIKTVTAIYDHGTVIHVYQAPIVVTILTNQHSNLGSIRSTAIPLLKEVLEPLCKTLLDSLAAPTNSNPGVAMDSSVTTGEAGGGVGNSSGSIMQQSYYV